MLLIRRLPAPPRARPGPLASLTDFHSGFGYVRGSGPGQTSAGGEIESDVRSALCGWSTPNKARRGTRPGLPFSLCAGQKTERRQRRGVVMRERSTSRHGWGDGGPRRSRTFKIRYCWCLFGDRVGGERGPGPPTDELKRARESGCSYQKGRLSSALRILPVWSLRTACLLGNHELDRALFFM